MVVVNRKKRYGISKKKRATWVWYGISERYIDVVGWTRMYVFLCI